MSAREVIADAVNYEIRAARETSTAEFADAILSALSEAGYTIARLEPIYALNDDGAGGAFFDAEHGNYSTYSRPQTTRVVGYRIVSPVAPPVSREAQ